MDYLFAPELCGEEQRLQEEATELMRRREEEVATRGSPTISRQVEKGIVHDIILYLLASSTKPLIRLYISL